MAGDRSRRKAPHRKGQTEEESPAPPRAPAPVPEAAPASAALRWGLPLALWVISFLAFAPALGHGFVELDDDANFTMNQAFRGLSGPHLEWMFTTFHVGHYQPLSWVSLGLDYVLWGTDANGQLVASGFHRTNLVLHAFNSVLLYWLILWLLRWGLAGGPQQDRTLRWCAAAGALLHAIHPLRVESVAWVTERRDLLSGLFLLLSVLAYLRRLCSQAAGVSGLGWLALSLLFYVASLLSKAWGITLPVVLLALDVFPLRRLATAERAGLGLRRLALEKLAYLPLAAVSAFLAARAQGSASAVISLEEHGVVQRLVQAAYGLAFYVWKTIVPLDLSALYILEKRFDVTRPEYLASVVFVGLASAALWLLRRRLPAGLATWFCYGVLASPVLGLLQSGSQKVADRYTYLSMMPFAVLAAGGIALAVARRGLRARLSAAAVGLVLVGLFVLTWRQTKVWESSESLFERVVEVEPENYFGHHNLAVVLHRQNRFEEALVHAVRSVEIHPEKGNEEARYNQGMLLQKLGRVDQAAAALEGALEVAPNHHGSLQWLEAHYARSARPEETIAMYERAVAADPTFVEGWSKLARLKASRGARAEVLELWQRARRANPSSALVHNGLAMALHAAGRSQEAFDPGRRAVELDNDNPDFFMDLAEIAIANGDKVNPRSWLQQVLDRYPGHARALELMRRTQ